MTLSDSGFDAVDSEFQLQDSGLLSLKRGFRIPIINGIPDSKAQDFEFQAKISWISESGFPTWEECDDAQAICQRLRCTFSGFSLLNKTVIFFLFSRFVCFVVVVVVPELSSMRRFRLISSKNRRFDENTRRNRPGSLMLQILQGQKILHFCALVHA